MSLIRDPFGEISWVKVAIMVIMLILVILIICSLVSDESMLMSFFGGFESDEKELEEPTIDNVRIAVPEESIHFQGEIFEGTKSCGELFCAVVRAEDADYFVHYDRAWGVLYEGEDVFVVGNMEDDIFMADSITPVKAYTSYTIG